MNKGRDTIASGDPGPIRPRVSEIFAALPPVPELRPFLDLLVGRSVADPERRWSGSGELGTVGDRLLDPGGLEQAAAKLEAAEAERISGLFRSVARVVEGVAAGDWEGVTGRLLEQGLADESLGRAQDSEAWFLSAHRLAKERGIVTAARALRLAARAARRLGGLDVAADRYEEAWRDAEALGLGEDATVAAIGRGNVEVDRGGWAEAKKWYERALARIGEGGPPRRERWQVLQNLAIVARRTGDLADAREALLRARDEGDALGDPDARVEVENGWGQLLLAEGDARGAELHFRAALGAARSPTARLAVTVNLGEALLLQGRSLEAGESAREAEMEALTGSLPQRLPEVYRLLAKVANQRGEGEAFVLLERALQLIAERGLPAYEEAVTREELGGIRLEQGELALGLGELEAAAGIYHALGASSAAARMRALIGRHAGAPEARGAEGSDHDVER